VSVSVTSPTAGSTAAVTSSGASVKPTSATQIAQVIPTEKPQVLEATAQNIEQAKNSVPIQQNPPPAPQSEIDRLRTLVVTPANPVGNAPTLVADNQGVPTTRNVLQWQPDWVQYDEFFRPVIFNLVNGAPRVVTIPALASMITEVATVGAYNFTAMVLNAAGVPTNVAVGNFFGGGYVPAPGQPPPAPPAVVNYRDVPVQVKYTNATYQPFVVNRIVDVGDDPAVGGRKVLLDGVTPAWGQWVQTPDGQRQFEVHKTQQFPGMEAPAEGPLPGDYQLQLVSSEQPAGGLSTKDILMIAGAAVVAALGLCAIVLPLVMRRRKARH
jgi:hypothetical protein